MSERQQRYEKIRAIYARLGSITGTAQEADCDRATVKAALGRPRRVVRKKRPPKPVGKLEPFLPMLRGCIVDDGLRRSSPLRSSRKRGLPAVTPS